MTSLSHLCSFHKDYDSHHSGYGHSGYGGHHGGYSGGYGGYGGYYGGGHYYKKRSVDKNCGKIDIDADFLICGLAVAGAVAARLSRARAPSPSRRSRA